MEMAHGYRFRLERYQGIKTRHTCPQCGKPRQFTRYQDTETGEHLADHVGRCERVNQCGYHYKPSEYFRDNPVQKPVNASAKRLTAKPAKALIPVDFIPKSVFEATTGRFDDNLSLFLIKKFGRYAVREAFKRLSVGTSRHWPGATVFWQVDAAGNVRTGKVILYDRSMGKRIKEPYPHVTWAHTLLKASHSIPEGFQLSQTLFGMNQLATCNGRAVVIVEAEKTAVICTIAFPEFTWMACGGITMLSAERLAPLKHTKIILYPDLNGAEAWQQKADQLSALGFDVSVSYLLERRFPDLKKTGLDIADFLLQEPFQKPPIETMIEKNPMLLSLIERFDLMLV